MSHSLIFVCCCPVIFVIILWLLTIKLPIINNSVSYYISFDDKIQLPTISEIIGAIFGFVGLIITAVDLNTDFETDAFDNNPTAIGDLSALAGALCMVIYMFAAVSIRQWMPVFFFSYPVNLVSCFVLYFLSYIKEDTQILSTNSLGFFGFIEIPAFWYILFLAFVPGFLGHIVISHIIKHIDAFVISIFVTLEPIIGTLIAWILGYSMIPSIWTILGGLLTFVSTIWVTYSSEKRRQQSKTIF
eukprot:TRINITY_DN3087_c0_g1_i1.p1 TRINITY_DN3087_c0_g1~~TRINITY_DN3087_c0_g1_i1.p1  ORF type:complete len:244 (+),score=60.43 TRINITY_DN3087_c0_g1_i1:503-1234(+)